MRVFKILTVPWKLFYTQYNPVNHWGAVMRGKVRIYSSNYKMFSFESYLVVLGDNIFIGVFIPPDETVVGGNPARVIKKTSDYIEKAKEGSCILVNYSVMIKLSLIKIYLKLINL